ncbi:MAG: phospholipase [Pseudohongiella sp.]|nr:MAG: phospholipase [Pseudohongiella sp.]
MRQVYKLISLLLLTLNSVGSFAQSGEEEFAALSFDSSKSIDLPYRLHSPTNALGEDVPLIVYLHGSGGWGDDNIGQISGGNVHGTHLWLEPAVASQNPAFVIAPQIPSPHRWSDADSDELSLYAGALIELIDQLLREQPIDKSRIYLIGQSLGGMGVWDIVAKRPKLFAAGIPVCGNGNPDRIVAAREVALWAFHGDADTAVPVTGSRAMVAKLRAVEGDIRYSEYEGVGHNSWERAFAEPELATWLSSKSTTESVR